MRACSISHPRHFWRSRRSTPRCGTPLRSSSDRPAVMNFFDHQRAAKGTTLKLVFLFAAAVIALVAAIDAAAVVAMLYLGSEHKEVDASAIVAVVVVVSAVTLLVIAGGMLFKTI